MSFWGLVVHPNKSYTQTVDTPFRITMACLSATPGAGRHSLTLTVEGESGNETYVLCNLTTDKTEQQQLDLVFEEGEQITLQMIGKSPIHLSGSYIPEESLPDYGMDDDESIDSDEAGFLDDDDEDDDEESEEGEERIPSGKLKELTGDEDDEEEESDEDEMEVEAPKPVKNQKQPATDGKRKAESTQTPQAEAKKAKTDVAAASAQKAIPAAALAKEAKKPADSAKATPAQKNAGDKATPATASKAQEVKGAKDSKQNTPSGASESGDKEPKKKTLPSGLALEDKIVGSGAKAKNGKTLAVRYIGKLANGKVFDSNTSGNPFKIQLGKGSVIKGWEVGLQGMNAGGTRVLVIPPNLAYGAKGAPPDIPPNSTLTFEIKLLSVD